MKTPRTCLISLGASKHREWPELDNFRFKNSSERFRTTFPKACITSTEVKELNLFDRDNPPGDTINLIVRFIEEHDPMDIVIHYCGHGHWTTDPSQYVVCLPSTQQNNAATALRLVDLASALHNQIANKRFYFILDSCFAGAGLREFMAIAPLRHALELLNTGPGRVLLAASDEKRFAIAKNEDDFTLFTGTFCDVLDQGDTTGSNPERLSWHDAFHACRTRIVERLGHNAPVPIFVSKPASHSDLGHTAFFWNGMDRRPPVETAGSDKLLGRAPSTDKQPERSPSQITFLIPLTATLWLLLTQTVGNDLPFDTHLKSINLPRALPTREPLPPQLNAEPPEDDIDFSDRASETNMIPAPQQPPPLASSTNGEQEPDSALNGHQNHLDKAAWKMATTSHTLEAYERYLDMQPFGAHRGDAVRFIVDIEDETQWQLTSKEHTPASTSTYLRRFPTGKYAADAHALVRRLDEDDAWNTARTANTAAAYHRYIIAFPNGRFTMEAKSAIDSKHKAPQTKKSSNARRPGGSGCNYPGCGTIITTD